MLLELVSYIYILNYYEEVLESITKNIDRGATLIQAEGAYYRNTVGLVSLLSVRQKMGTETFSSPLSCSVQPGQRPNQIGFLSDG